jgi:hypothetical protein
VQYASASPDAGIETITVRGASQANFAAAALQLAWRAALFVGRLALRAAVFIATAIGSSTILAYNQIAVRVGWALRAPPAFNTTFGNIVGNLFKATDTIAGGTAGAIRHTATTGKLVGGTDHIAAGLQRVQALDRVLRGNVNALDSANAAVLRQDLVNALGQAGVKVP